MVFLTYFLLFWTLLDWSSKYITIPLLIVPLPRKWSPRIFSLLSILKYSAIKCVIVSYLQLTTLISALTSRLCCLVYFLFVAENI